LNRVEVDTGLSLEESQGANYTQPILVTGMARSGTSWVGKMLEASRRVLYINEPLNLRHPSGLLLQKAPDCPYQYLTRENDAPYLSSFQQLLRLRRPFWFGLGQVGTRDLVRGLKYSGDFLIGRCLRLRPLLKDPFAVFSAEWFVHRLHCLVVATVRDPGAVVSSHKRLGWKVDFRHFLQQELLIRDWLFPFLGEMEKMLASPDDLIAQNCLLWRMIYHSVWKMQSQVPGIRAVRHEDLSIAPLEQYPALYNYLGLPYSEHASSAIHRATSGKSRNDAFAWSVSLTGISRTSFQNLDSRENVSSWKERLSEYELSRIRDLTADVARLYYSDQK
jgi:hypothetical protein